MQRLFFGFSESACAERCAKQRARAAVADAEMRADGLAAGLRSELKRVEHHAASLLVEPRRRYLEATARLEDEIEAAT